MSLRQTFLISFAAVALAEVLAVVAGPVAGMIVYALLVSGLAVAYVRAGPSEGRQLLVALLLVALFRLMTLGSPFGELSVAGRCVAVGAPTWVAMLIARRLPEVKEPGFGLTWRSVAWTPAQVGVAAAGIPLAGLAFLALRPGGALHQTVPGFIFDVIALAAFSAVLEEVLFRRLLLRSLTRLYGRQGIIAAAAVFALVYIGTRSIAMVALALVVGLGFGWWSERSDSVVASSVAHTIINLGVFLAVAPLGLRVLG